MSRLNTINALFRHFDWAQEKMLAAAAGISKEDLNRPFDIGPGTLRKALHHIHDAERVWLERCTHNPAATVSAPDENAPITDIRKHATEVAAKRKSFLESLKEPDADRPITFTRRGETATAILRHIIVQVCNHGMHHRAQAVNMMRALGVKPPLTEYLFMQIESPIDPQPQLSLQMLRDYLKYTDWARDLVFNASASLSDEQLDRHFETGMGSVRKTLVHLDDTDRWWFSNWTSDNASVFPVADPSVSLADLRKRFEQTTQQRGRFLASLSEQDLNRPIKAQPEEGKFLTFPLGHTMIEICNHGTHHRSQAINMLRQIGVTVPPNDYFVWIRETQPPASKPG
jgi:uncharacterized damage-inducible protein DinB